MVGVWEGGEEGMEMGRYNGVEEEEGGTVIGIS